MLPSRSKSLSGPSSGPKGPVLIEGLLEKKKTFGSSKFFCSLRDGKLWYSEDKVRLSRLVTSVAPVLYAFVWSVFMYVYMKPLVHAFVWSLCLYVCMFVNAYVCIFCTYLNIYT